MNLWLFIMLYAINSLFWKWIISWGGAKWVESCCSFILIDWFALDWTAEQIRFYALLMWLISSIYFVIGLIYPQYRF